MNSSFIQKEDKPSLKTMIIFIGIQGSGKTHYYNKYMDGIYEHVNLDELHTRNKERMLIQQF